jgi:hypothetical protein
MHLSRRNMLQFYLLFERLWGVEKKSHWKRIFLGVWFQMPPLASLHDLSLFFTKFVEKQNRCLVWKSDSKDEKKIQQTERFWQTGFACRELQRILKLVVAFTLCVAWEGVSAAKLSFELAPFCLTTAIITQLLSH